ncbi:MAG: DUF3592 domain-containing protein [Candidatus Odinarchaeota archaeon]
MADPIPNDPMFLVVGLFLTGGGLLSLYACLKTLLTGKQSLNWPSVEGEITVTRLLRRKRRNRPASYFAYILYTYYLDGRKYVSNQRRVSPQITMSKKAAEELLDRYRLGTKVTVYHHPEVHAASKFELSGPLKGMVTAAASLVADYPGGVEIYKASSSPSKQLHYARDDIRAQDATVGNALLEPGVNMANVILLLLLGITFLISGMFFLVSQF